MDFFAMMQRQVNGRVERIIAYYSFSHEYYKIKEISCLN